MHLKDLRHVTDSHSHTIREERGEISDTGDGEGSAGGRGGTNSGVEIEHPLIQTRFISSGING